MKVRSHLFPAPILRFMTVLFLSAGFVLLIPIPFKSYAHTKEESVYLSGRWIRDEVGWRYLNQWNQAFPAGQWAEYEGSSYYFMDNGYMATSWHLIHDHWYYFNPQKGKFEGAMVKGWITDPEYNARFYTNSLGIMVTGWHKIDGSWYYFNQNLDGVLGEMAVSRVVDGSYVDASGKMNEER